MADGIIFEKLGVPAVAIVTDAFTKSGDAMARRQGMPGYRYAMVPHPMSSLTPEECKLRAREVLDDVLAILGLAEGAAAPAPQPAAAATAAVPDISDITSDRIRDMERLMEYYFAQGWTDGLPVVPASEERVREWAAYVRRDPKEVIAKVEHLERECTIELAAAAAIMAGCQKEHFPVVLAAVQAFTAPRGYATGLLQSTTGQAQLVIVNGPVRGKLGFNSQGNVFGSGFRANASVGRAMRLIAINAFGLRPHEFDQSTQGTPAKYSFCIAENEEESPWEPLHVERGFRPDESAVTVHFARSALHVENRVSNQPEKVLLTIADSMSYAGNWGGGRGGFTVVMGPEHAHLLAKQGWTKQKAKEFLWENWGRRRGDLRRFGLLPPEQDQGPDDEFLHSGRGPDSILLIVAGARNAGVSTVITSLAAEFFSAPIVLP